MFGVTLLQFSILPVIAHAAVQTERALKYWDARLISFQSWSTAATKEQSELKTPKTVRTIR